MPDYVGKLDANCAWPGVLSMVRPLSSDIPRPHITDDSLLPYQLRLIRSQYQDVFINSPDLPWTGENATVRAIGPGAGNFTYVLMDGAGHLVCVFIVLIQTPRDSLVYSR